MTSHWPLGSIFGHGSWRNVVTVVQLNIPVTITTIILSTVSLSTLSEAEVLIYMSEV